MDADTSQDAFLPPEDENVGRPESESNNIGMSEGLFSDGDIMQELENVGKILSRVELDIAWSCEKLVNLYILVMHVETRESEFEAFISDTEHNLSDFGEKAMEFDLLSGILDSEVRELESFMYTLQTDIVNTREILSSHKHLGEALTGMEDQLHDSEKSLKQSLEQVSEIKMQSANFQRILTSFGGEENWEENKHVELLENGDPSDLKEKIKMQTAEQQRHILRMLEKSLARELDLEKKMTESRQIEEDLKLRMHSSGQEILYVEEEVEVAWEMLFEADNKSEVLMGISKELLGQLHILQFNLNGSVQREGEMRFKLVDTIEQLIAKDSALQKLERSNAELDDLSRLKEVEDKLAVTESETTNLKEKVSLLEKELKDSELQLLNAKACVDSIQNLHSEIHEMGNMIKDLKEKVSKAESRAESAEAKYKLLTETNNKLNEELSLLKRAGNESDRVDSLEKQLRESEIQLQHAETSAEASQEKQSMLYLTIKDMENVIEDLKSKVSKAESQTESAEEKCILLSVSNSDLSEELSFLRGRMECMEASLHKAEETKIATAKDISLHSKLITDLIMQLALERERLQKQISSLKQENKIFVRHSKTHTCPAVKISHDGKGNSREFLLSKLDFTTVTRTKENKEEATGFSSTSFEPDKTQKDISMGETEMGLADSTSKLVTGRNIDARQLDFKYVSVVVLMLVIPVVVALFLQHLDT